MATSVITLNTMQTKALAELMQRPEFDYVSLSKLHGTHFVRVEGFFPNARLLWEDGGVTTPTW